jgi:hypothetical protein
MKKAFLLSLSVIAAITSFSQFTYKIKADSTRLYNDSCNAELIIENATRNVPGFLYNRGNGRTEFRKPMVKLNDSTYLFGTDTLKLNAMSYTFSNGLTNTNGSVKLGGSFSENSTDLILNGSSSQYLNLLYDQSMGDGIFLEHSPISKKLEVYLEKPGVPDGTYLDFQLRHNGTTPIIRSEAYNNTTGIITNLSPTQYHINLLSGSNMRIQGLADGTPTKALGVNSTGVLVTYPLSGMSSTNIYNTNGTLTGSRVLNGANQSLTFDSTQFIVKGVYGTNGNSLGVSGEGTRMMFYPKKAAFRAGGVNGNQWDDINIGNYSNALGQNNKVGGYAGFAAGENNQVDDNYSAALGYGNIVSGANSFGIGNGNTASGFFSIAIGQGNTSTATHSNAFGHWTTASKNYAFVFGGTSTANGLYSVVMGERDTTNYDYSMVFGQRLYSPNPYATVFGKWNDKSTAITKALAVGWGTSEATRKDIFYVDANGNIFGNALRNSTNIFKIPTETFDDTVATRSFVRGFGNGGSNYSFSNGLINQNDGVKLGGFINEPTIIETIANFSIASEGTTFSISPSTVYLNAANGLNQTQSGLFANGATTTLLGEVNLPNYPVTRNNGSATKFLTTDSSGNVQLKTVNFSSAGSGTVTSVALTTPSWLSVSGSPVTTTGTLAVTATTGQTANQFLATPDGSTGAVGLRSIVAADIPNLDASKITTGTMSTARLGSGTANNTTYLGGDQAYHSALMSKAVSFQAPTASENVTLWYTPVALTITEVAESAQGTSPSVTYNIRYASTRNAGSPTNVFSSNRTVTTSAGTSVTSFANASIPAGSWIWIVTSATSGTVSDFNATIIYRQ